MTNTNVKEILAQLTLKEKASLCSGSDFWHLENIERLGIPNILLTDGPHGIRKQPEVADNLGINVSEPATCFPTAVGLASSWDKELISEVGKYLAEECISKNVSILLGPGANIKRSPLCGRNFEYFSEDPYLSGKLAASFINSVQSKGIGTSLKHFVANNQEGYRLVVNTIIDERTLREIYLKGFEIAVKESQPWTVMCSYNLINDVYVSENKKILQDILKDEWKHKGIVLSDWGACNDRVLGLKAGQDIEMPSSCGVNDALIVKAVLRGQLDIALLDERVTRILELILKAKETLEKDKVQYKIEDHHAFAKEVATNTFVLLKNENDILPLSKDSNIALIGDFAVTPRYQGSGSSLINPTKVDNAFDSFKDVLNDKLLFAKGYESKEDIVNQELIDDAVEIASKVDTVVLMIGLTDAFESEGFDRTHLNIPNNQLVLIDKIYEVNKNIVVTLSNGAPVIMPWLDKTIAVVEQYLGGQASGSALVDVLFGNVNPSGKLAETFPNSLNEYPSSQNFADRPKLCEYREGLYVGYRYYDSANVKPLFPFGFGLSYTKFEYTDLKIDSQNIDISKSVKVSFKVKNIGKRDGKEIVQVYVKHRNSSVYKPEKELKYFDKVNIKSGKEETISFELDYSAFEYYSVEQECFVVEEGSYIIAVGDSSANIILHQDVFVNGIERVKEGNNSVYNSIDNTFAPTISDFELLLGRTVPPYPKDKPYTWNSTFTELEKTFIGKKMVKAIFSQYDKNKDEIPDGMYRMLVAMVRESPYRSTWSMSNGQFTKNRAYGFLCMMNKHYIKGLWYLCKRK